MKPWETEDFQWAEMGATAMLRITMRRVSKEHHAYLIQLVVEMEEATFGPMVHPIVR